jgi:hypothetical protein
VEGVARSATSSKKAAKPPGHGEAEMTAAPRMHLVAVGHVPRSPYPRSGDSGDHLVADKTVYSPSRT